VHVPISGAHCKLNHPLTLFTSALSQGKIQLHPPVERVVVKVDSSVAPLAAENFVAICDGV
jgi:hypothetical protein